MDIDGQNKMEILDYDEIITEKNQKLINSQGGHFRRQVESSDLPRNTPKTSGSEIKMEPLAKTIFEKICSIIA